MNRLRDPMDNEGFAYAVRRLRWAEAPTEAKVLLLGPEDVRIVAQVSGGTQLTLTTSAAPSLCQRKGIA
jgi:hypothetical protein